MLMRNVVKKQIAENGLPHWFIIQDPKTDVSTLVHTFDGIEMYWGHSISHCPFIPREWRVAWYFGQLDPDDPVLDDVPLIIDACNPVKLYDGEPSFGFIAPDGTFYTCKFVEHNETAIRLVARLYPDRYGNEDAQWVLQDEGWIIVHMGLAEHEYDPTPKQLKVAKEIVAKAMDKYDRYTKGLTYLVQDAERTDWEVNEPQSWR